MADTKKPTFAPEPERAQRKKKSVNGGNKRHRSRDSATIRARGSKSCLLRYPGDHRAANRQTHRAGWRASGLRQNRRDETGRLRPDGGYRLGEVRRRGYSLQQRRGGDSKKTSEAYG